MEVMCSFIWIDLIGIFISQLISTFLHDFQKLSRLPKSILRLLETVIPVLYLFSFYQTGLVHLFPTWHDNAHFRE